MEPVTITLIAIGATVGAVKGWKKYSNRDSARGSKASGGSTSTGAYIEPTSNPGGNNNTSAPPPQIDQQSAAPPPSAGQQASSGPKPTAQEAAASQETTSSGKTETKKKNTKKKDSKKKEEDKNKTVTAVIIVGVSLLLVFSPIALIAMSLFGAGALLTGAMAGNTCTAAIQTYRGAQGDLSSDFKINAGQDQTARLIYDTALDMDMGENGALVAIYTAIAESNMHNWEEDGPGEPGSTSRGIYRQIDDWAGDTVWSGQTPPAGQTAGYYFDKKNAWGPNGWAEHDRRMDQRIATKLFLNAVRTDIKEGVFNGTKVGRDGKTKYFYGITTMEDFRTVNLTDEQLYTIAFETQGFGGIGQYDTVAPKARVLLNQAVSTPGFSGQYDVIDAVYTTSTGGIVRPVNAALGTPYGQEGAAWSSGYHTGSDYPAANGTPLYAAAGGVVTFAGRTNGTYQGGYGPYGNMVKMETPGPNGEVIELRYAHMSVVKVAKGQKVSAGQLIGAVGNTGNVLPRGAGWHLHFEVLVDGVNIDPEIWFSDNAAGSTTGVAPEVGPVFVVGDSLTANISLQNAFAKEMTGIDYTIVAEQGKSIGWGLDEVLSVNPDAVAANTWIVALGTNDTGGENATEEYFSGRIDEVMALAGSKNVVWINIYLSGRPEATAAMNNALNTATQRYPNLKIVDYAGLLQDNINFLEPDGIHLDANGYRWRAALYSQGLGGLNPNNTSGAQAECDEALDANSQGVADISQYGAAPATNPYADAAVRYALAQVGKPYSYSANPPYSWDCSKLTAAAWDKAGVPGIVALSYTQFDTLPRLPGGADLSVVRQSLQPGDLLFYFGSGAHHVSMYIGNDKMVHAANPGDGVEVISIDDPWYVQRFSGAGRPSIPV